MSNVFLLHDTPLNRIYAVAEQLTEADINQGSALATSFKAAVQDALGAGVVPLRALCTYLLSGGDAAVLFKGLSKKLDACEDRGFPSLSVVAADYFRQMDIDPNDGEGRELVRLCEAVDQFIASHEEADVRSFHEALHLSFVSLFALPVHSTVEVDGAILNDLAASALLQMCGKEHSEELASFSDSSPLLTRASLRLAFMSANFDKGAMRQRYDDLLDADVSDEESAEIITSSLLADVIEMHQACYLRGTNCLMTDPITLVGDLLTPSDNVDFLHEAFGDDEVYIEYLPEEETGEVMRPKM